MSEQRYLLREFNGYDHPETKAAFAVVKVESVERTTDNSLMTGEGQIADCGVLFDVLGDGIVIGRRYRNAAENQAIPIRRLCRRRADQPIARGRRIRPAACALRERRRLERLR